MAFTRGTIPVNIVQSFGGLVGHRGVPYHVESKVTGFSGVLPTLPRCQGQKTHLQSFQFSLIRFFNFLSRFAPLKLLFLAHFFPRLMRCFGHDRWICSVDATATFNDDCNDGDGDDDDDDDDGMSVPIAGQASLQSCLFFAYLISQRQCLVRK